jgi:predicted MFS family arabinose efflux permease
MNAQLAQTLRTWMPALAGMTCLGLSAGLVGIFGFFVAPLSQEFDVSVAALNMAPVLLLLVPGILSPLIGRLIDRMPARRLILAGSGLAMLSLFLVSRAPSPFWALIAFFCFALGFVCYGPVAINGLMVKLYPGREGKALAIVAMGISVSSVTLPLIVGSALQLFDWRTTLGALSIGMLLALWLWVFLAIPGDAGGSVEGSSRKVAGNIYRRREFWLVGVTVALALNVMVVLTICYPPLFAQRGFTPVEAGLFLAVAGAGGALGKLSVAGLADRFSGATRLIVAGILLLKLLGLALLLNAGTTVAVTASVFMMGFAGGSMLPLSPYLNSRYFDAAVIGQVNGAQAPLFLPLGLVGPPLAGYVFDQTGSYDLVLMALMAIQLAALLMVSLLPKTR